MVHKIALLAVTNGLQHYYCRIDFEEKNYQFIEELPGYHQTDLSADGLLQPGLNFLK